jgi:transposase
MNVLQILNINDALDLHKIVIVDSRIQLHLSTTTLSATCPCCKLHSSKQHSVYHRQAADLPWAGKSLDLFLRVQRFFCVNPSCKKKTFAVPLNSIQPFARHTRRLQDHLTLIAHELGGRKGAKVAAFFSMNTSNSTLLRLIYNQKEPTIETPAILGIDDWSLKRGVTYATILVDIEKQRPIDMFPGREASTLQQWLINHPGVRVITRDRYYGYAEGATTGAPKAIQVADRWHLLKNLQDVLKRILNKNTGALRKAAYQIAEEHSQTTDQPLIEANSGRNTPTTGYALRFHEAKRLLNEGKNVRSVARILKMSRKTVHRYQYLDEYPAKHVTTISSVFPWQSYLVDRWNQGEHNRKELWREIRAKGFKGHVNSFYRFFNHYPDLGAKISKAELQVKNWSAAKVGFLLSKPEERLVAEEKAYLNALFIHCEKAKLARSLALEFYRIFKEKQPEELPSWINRATTSGISAMKTFATGLKSDYRAIEAAATYSWSNGPVEGHINRLKTIKRQMYGRASFDLLRKRVIHSIDSG